MSEQSIYSYRLTSINGIVADFQSQNGLEAMWTLLRGVGYFQLVNEKQEPIKRIAWHAIASIEYLDQKAAMIYGTAASESRN